MSVVLNFVAGEKRPLPLSFRQPDGTPLDLTGARVLLTAADSASAEEPVELFRVERSEHASPATGDTALLIDLSELPSEIYSAGKSIDADLWIIDSQEHRTSYGVFTLKIAPSVTRDFSEPAP